VINERCYLSQNLIAGVTAMCEIYKEGRKAFKDGLLPHDNPYFNLDGDKWLDGWVSNLYSQREGWDAYPEETRNPYRCGSLSYRAWANGREGHKSAPF
jgi:hypothetical protein